MKHQYNSITVLNDNETKCDCNEWNIASIQETYLNLSVCDGWKVSYTRTFAYTSDLLSAKDITTNQRSNIPY